MTARQMLLSGEPVPTDGSHATINPETGMQRDYVVLSAEERAKGFVKPVRMSYTHRKCGSTTWMGIALAETYARDPSFYSGTFCAGCREHFHLREFDWRPDGEPMEPSLQATWRESAERLARNREQWRQQRISELRKELAMLESEAP